jgi:hypothetical protein
MSELIPTTKLAPLLPGDISVDHCIEIWLDLIDATDDLLRAGLRREVGPCGDLRAAYRQWSAAYRQSHDEAIQRRMDKLSQLES